MWSTAPEMANKRFAVAAANWESVGGARTPESEGFTAEQIEIAGKATAIERGRNESSGITSER